MQEVQEKCFDKFEFLRSGPARRDGARKKKRKHKGCPDGICEHPTDGECFLKNGRIGWGTTINHPYEISQHRKARFRKRPFGKGTGEQKKKGASRGAPTNIFPRVRTNFKYFSACTRKFRRGAPCGCPLWLWDLPVYRYGNHSFQVNSRIFASHFHLFSH